MAIMLVLQGFAQDGKFTGMGNASVMLYDVWSAVNNQAGISDLEKPVAGICYSNKFQLKETSTQTAVFALPTRTGNFALSYHRFGYSLYSENKLGLAYARNLGKYISAGLQFDYLYYHQAENYGNKGAFLMEFGLIARPIERFYIGVHLYNPTRTKLADYNDERVPGVMRFGLGYLFSDQVTFTIETEKDLVYQARFKCGLEYQAVKNLFLRTGFKTGPDQFSVGLGYFYHHWSTDLAFVTHPSLPLSTQASLTYSF